jgi:uncharacterized protein (TIGR03790 family)
MTGSRTLSIVVPVSALILGAACGSLPATGSSGSALDAGETLDSAGGVSQPNDAGGNVDGAASKGGASDAGDASTDGTVADASTPSYPPRRSPDEVLLVYNMTSPISTAIANMYAQARNVTNVLSVTCADSAVSSDNETIEFADYTSEIAGPISQYLADHTNINFIVLTKGVPIRIDGADTGCCQDVQGDPGQPSVDSYLAAIDYPTLPGATKIGITGSGTIGTGWLNRYWGAAVPFTHAKFGGYLVMRLDGYTQADAEALITNALASEASHTTGNVIFDIPLGFGIGDKTIEPAPVTGTILEESAWGTWNADMLRAHDMLEATGIPNDLAMEQSGFVGNQQNVVGYWSWGSNDPNFDDAGYQSNMFAPGSFSDTAVSTAGRTFLPTSGGQSLIVDLIAHGLTFVKGYVGEPVLQAVASPTIALNRFYSGYTVAESFYAASHFVGWEDVVIGDPLATPYYGSSGVVLPTYASNFDASSGGVQTEQCAESGLDVGSIVDGAYTVYKNVQLTGAATLVVRVASAGSGGNVELHLDSATGTMLGSCTVPVTGDWQTWVTQTCPLSDTSGAHDVYLVYTGSGGADLFNVEWFALRPANGFGTDGG